MINGPLNGVKILDLTHVWAGPLATRILSDLGAEVIKIEAPHRRGPLNVIVQPMAGWIGGEPRGEPWNRNAIFVKLARNSRSVSMDLKSVEGRSTFLELVEVADIVIENFSARTMPSLGLDYETLRATNPRVINVTMPGFGTYGPYRDRVAFGPTVEPMSGLTNVMGYGPDEPRNTAMALVDPIAAVSATVAIVSALREREVKGEGMLVEMSLHESGVSFSGPWLIEHQLGGEVRPLGNGHPMMAPHGVYPCKGDDDWVALACTNQADWRILAEVLGEGWNPELSLDERREKHPVIDEAISNWTSLHHKAEAVSILQSAGIPAGSVNATPDMIEDVQVKERGFFVPLDEGVPMPGFPIKMQGLSSEDWTPCPKLGADNHEVLKSWLGYSDEQVEELFEKGVLADKPPV